MPISVHLIHAYSNRHWCELGTVGADWIPIELEVRIVIEIYPQSRSLTIMIQSDGTVIELRSKSNQDQTYNGQLCHRLFTNN